MGWRDKWYPDTLAALSRIRGDGPSDEDSGDTYPAISSIDAIAIFGMIAKSTATALGNFHKSVNGSSNPNDFDGGLAPIGPLIQRSDWIDHETGISFLHGLSVSPGSDPTSGDAPWIDITTYLSYVPRDDAAIRSRSNDPADPTFEPCLTNNNESDILSFVHQMMNEYSHVCNAAVAGIMAAGSDASQPMALAEAAGFWSAVRAWCVDLDVLNENPPEPTYDKIVGALHAAIAKTGEFIGKSAAEIAEQVGKTAADVTSGFFGEAGPIALAVTGIVVYLFLR
jgi:hypothetical protein